MGRVLDEAATIQMLRDLQIGDSPLEPGDVFHHPSYGPMTVSRIRGWESAWHIDNDHQLKDIGDTFVVTAIRQGRKRAEKVIFLPPATRSEEVVPGA